VKVYSGFKMSQETKRMLSVTPKENLSFMKKLFIGAEIGRKPQKHKAKQAKIKDNSKPDLEA
jgi:hypothetical protein